MSDKDQDVMVSIYGKDFPAAAKCGSGATSLCEIRDAINERAA
jgi:hypothetical protein